MTRVAIVTGSRTPIAKANGAYRDIHAVDLLSVSMSATVEKAGIDPSDVDRALVGCTHQMGAQAMNIGRNAWLAAGLPHTVPALTLDAQCCSGQEVANLGFALIASGQADAILVGGVESLTQVPSGSTAGKDMISPFPPSLLEKWSMPHQGIAGERVAKKYGITREEADDFGVQSHVRADAAWANGDFDDEIVMVHGADGPLLTRDEGIRPDSSVEKAAGLKPAFDPEGIVTAANASQLSDGAATLLLASEEFCTSRNLQPLAWITATASTGSDPDFMLEGPLSATESVLKRAGIDIGEVEHIEIHEAFAIPVLVWLSHFSVAADTVNVHGGAIGMGHPFGASGTRQLLHLSHLVSRSGGRGLQAMCGGGGLGSATLIEAP